MIFLGRFFSSPDQSPPEKSIHLLCPSTRANFTSSKSTATIHVLQSRLSLPTLISHTFLRHAPNLLINRLLCIVPLSYLLYVHLVFNSIFPTLVLFQCSKLKVKLQILHKVRRKKQQNYLWQVSKWSQHYCCHHTFEAIHLQLCYKWLSLGDCDLDGL